MRSTPAPASETLASIEALRFVAERLLPRNMTLPEEPESARMLRALGATEVSRSPPADFLEELRRSLVARGRSGRIAELPRKELRYAPWLLWNGEPPAASLPGLLPILLDQARASPATLRRLIGAYLRDFDPRAPGIDEAAACIRGLLAGAGPRFDLWRIAQTEVRLFDPARGPKALADRLLADEQPTETLSRYKLDDPMLSVGKYLMAVEEAVRAETPQMLRNQRETGLQRVRQVVAPLGALRFGAQAGATGRAMLRAWLDGGPEPAPTLQQPVREMLLRWLGDPRLRPQRWAGVGEQETSLMRRWLTRASLDLFFKLIDRHALDQHWRYRHAFWLIYLERGAIADAWLALGSQTFNEAATIRDLGGAYGRLKGGAADQSALLLRVGPLVIGEFTHNGSLRAWPVDWPDAPKLGEAEYASARLKRTCLPFPPNPYWGKGGATTGKGLFHINSPAGYWQGSAAALIERHAGVRITPSDWRPK